MKSFSFLREGIWYLIFLSPLTLIAQDYFGKNKLQYEKIRFLKRVTPHFEIYYPEGGEKLCAFASLVVEDQAESLEKKLNLKKKDKTPIILYPSFSSFSSTNIILDLIEEGVGGFAELLKRRVVVPFDGSLLTLERVLRHEVSHIYEYEIFFKSRFSLFARSPVPFFILEGFSEYNASKVLGPDYFSEVFLRDYVVSQVVSFGKLISDESYLAYRLGEAFFFFLDEKYGEGKVYELLNTLKKKPFSEAIKDCFGKSPSALGEDFSSYLRLKYFSLYSLSLRDTLLSLLTHSKRGTYNTTPVISPKGDKVLFLSNVRGDFSLYLIDTYSGKIIRKLIKVKQIKEVRFLKRAVTITDSPSEKIAFFARKDGKTELQIQSLERKGATRRYPIPLDECFDPTFSPDGKNLVFVGLADGYQDLYLLSLESGKMERITTDFLDDASPSFTQDGDTIIFVKREGCEERIARRVGIWAYSRKGGTLHKLSEGLPEAKNPIRLPSGELLFLGEGGQIFLRDTSGSLFKTNFFSGFEHLSCARDGKLSFSYFKNGAWEIAVSELSDIQKLMEPATPSIKEETALGQLKEEKGEPIGFSLAADYAQGALSWTPGIFSGYVYVAVSDILGDHRFFILTDLSGVIDFSNFYFSYWYLKERVDYQFTIYQFIYGYEGERWLWVYRDRGLAPVLMYPFNKEERMEFGLGLFSDQNWIYERRGEEWFAYDSSSTIDLPTFFAYVFDNTSWQKFGPKKGTRVRLSGQISFWQRNYYTAYLDSRHYLSFFDEYILATRLLNIGSFGREPDSFFIDGSLCRGYDYYEFFETTGPYLCATQLEFRFPLIKELKLGLPPLTLGDIAGRLFLDGSFLLKNPKEWRRETGWLVKFGWGMGIGVYIPPFPIRIDFSYPLSATENRNWKITLNLGEEF